MTTERVFMTDAVEYDAVGPIMRSGDIADAVIDAVAEDNPGRDVYVTDRGDYLHIHTLMDCRLTRASLERNLGRSYDLSMLEIEMPSFAGRMQTSDKEYRWYLKS
ncbi:MmoB/DmpM family protein [Ramlibacter sp. WS9]|uniref:MmoB/DmpM family protein n=1 Tax=Ramlibacter sp. WS9 TaxID=1882741 RepID=UPI00117562A2|nr:MmoB/DmpM family protein [Ramlibacter sp. WS9]ROZ78063.1 monooxygenase [Ramlibacter sp. WS9]HSV35775.1 MmoB/DmpM family protein [Ramlibacter sp.]